MTQEEKAKAYDEALTIAKRIISKNCSEVEKLCLKSIFPELAESEDEKMINELQGFLDSFGADYFGTGEWQKFHDWLEKQKEQKPVEKQDYSGLNDLERVIHRGFLAAGVENVPAGIIKETAQECLTNIKPAEWSEEDEKNLELVTDCVYEFYPDPVMKYKLKDWLKSLRPSWRPSEEQMEWLKSAVILSTNKPHIHGSIISLYEQLKKL